MYARMKQLTLPSASWTATNPVLMLGEFGFASDTNIVKVGDGVSAWNTLTAINNSGGGGSSMAPGYNCFTWLPATTDALPLTGATLSASNGINTCVQSAAAGTTAAPAGRAGIPSKGFNQSTQGTVTLEGYILRTTTSAGTSLVGLSAGGTLATCTAFAGFALDNATGDVKGFTYYGGSINVGTIPATAGVQRGSTQSGALSLYYPIYFKVSYSNTNVITLKLDTTTVYSGSPSVFLNPTGSSGIQQNLVANQCSTGVNTATGQFIVSYS